MKKLLLVNLVIILASCNSVKINQRYISQGNYDSAIDLALKKLQKNRYSAKAEEHILLLEEAFKKAVDKDKRAIKFYKKTDDPEAIRNIYYTYVLLDERQEKIRPLLPLRIVSQNRDAHFHFEDYSEKIAHAREAFENQLYQTGKLLMSYNTKEDYKEAYSVFCELTDINPLYKDAKQLREEAHFKGTDFVLVQLKNYSGILIPFNLENDLLNFNTYGLDNFWMEFHNAPQNGIDYNYGIDLIFRTIQISPERIFEKEIHKEKEIKTGWEYKKDRNGNIVHDENGNPIKIDVFETVEADLLVTTQSKAAHISGEVIFNDLKTGRQINTFPLETEFVFENIFATYQGDKRALEKEDLDLIKNRFVPFPSNEQMIYDAGEDLKNQLRDILKNNSFY